MILIKCDRCKEIISSFVYRISPEKFSNADYGMSNPLLTGDDILVDKIRSMQLCRDCVEQVAAYLMNYNVDINSEGGGTAHTQQQAGSRAKSAA